MNTIQITPSDYQLLQNLLANQAATSPEEKACRASLLGELARARIVEAGDIGSNVITLNSKARMTDLESGDLLEFTLVMPQDADVSKGRISILAPLGTAMLGFRSGETFEWTMPGGLMKLRIDEVTKPQ